MYIVGIFFACSSSDNKDKALIDNSSIEEQKREIKPKVNNIEIEENDTYIKVVSSKSYLEYNR